MGELSDVVSSAFFRNALIEAAIVSVVAGVVGTHVVLRRLPFFVVALSHATLPGIVIAGAIGVGVIAGASVLGVLIALAVVLGAGRSVDRSSLIGVVLAGSFALGVVLSSTTGGTGNQLSAYLVGSILSITNQDLVTTGVLGAAVVAVVVALHKELSLVGLDPAMASALGYSRLRLDMVLLISVALSVAVMVPAVGTLLTLALLALPAATAQMWAKSISTVMIGSIVLALLASVTGLLTSVVFDIASSGAIALVACVVFLLSLTAQSCRRRLERARIGRRPGNAETGPLGKGGLRPPRGPSKGAREWAR